MTLAMASTLPPYSLCATCGRGSHRRPSRLLLIRVRSVKDDKSTKVQRLSLLPSEQERPGSDLRTLLRRFSKAASPYWSSEDKKQARIRLVGVFALTLATTGISVGFNFLGRDFYNALANKNQDQFMKQLVYYLVAFVVGIPIFVFRDFCKDTLSLRWRAWMTEKYLSRYFQNRAFYSIQSQSLVDNPDQRIVDDLSTFTATSLGFSLALFNAAIDLVSFSGILYGIYPPLFGILVVYSIGGTAISVALGKGLVNLNFMQEKREADFRYGLVRVRENAESIAFYGGEKSEMQLLLQRFKQSFDNYIKLLISSRNLSFFQSGYRYVIQVLPAAVVAPLYFSGQIEFGVINQSFSAFNHILGDFSIIVFQFQGLSAFSAVIDRLGEFSDMLEAQAQEASHKDTGVFQLLDTTCETSSNAFLLQVEDLTLQTPQGTLTLVENLTCSLREGQSLLVMGASGSGKTSLLRAIAGLWRSGKGVIKRYLRPRDNGTALRRETGDIFFLPQKPYLVLGTLRQQLLYPTDTEVSSLLGPSSTGTVPEQDPSDDTLLEVVREVRLSHLMDRCDGLDSSVDWASVLSLGEQQRLAFARLILSKPRLALLDEATSALDEETEAYLYDKLRSTGTCIISVGHRSTLRRFHSHLLTLSGRDAGWSLEELSKEPEMAYDV